MFQLFVFALCISSVLSASCPALQCSNSGQNCSDTTALGDCNMNNFCLNQTCTPVKPLGAACDSSLSDYSGQCEWGTCVLGVCNLGRLPGMPCAQDYECRFYNSSEVTARCVNNQCYGLKEGETCSVYNHQCMLPLRCDGTKCVMPPTTVGAPCTDNRYCGVGLKCHEETCIKPLNEGEKCDRNAMCADPNVCYGDGVCRKIFSGSLNASCDRYSECSDGLYCARTSTSRCEQGTKKEQSSKTLCNNHLDCGELERCSCDGNGIQRCYMYDDNFGNMVGQQKAAQDALICTAQCAKDDLSCYYSKCRAQICNDIAFDAMSQLYSAIGSVDPPQCAIDKVFYGRIKEDDDYALYQCTMLKPWDPEGSPTTTGTTGNNGETSNNNGGTTEDSSSIQIQISGLVLLSLLVLFF